MALYNPHGHAICRYDELCLPQIVENSFVKSKIKGRKEHDIMYRYS
jgi:hypothetical protein